MKRKQKTAAAEAKRTKNQKRATARKAAYARRKATAGAAMREATVDVGESGPATRLHTSRARRTRRSSRRKSRRSLGGWSSRGWRTRRGRGRRSRNSKPISRPRRPSRGDRRRRRRSKEEEAIAWLSYLAISGGGDNAESKTVSSYQSEYGVRTCHTEQLQFLRPPHRAPQKCPPPPYFAW